MGEASLHPSSNVSLSWDYYFDSLLFVSYYIGLFLRIIRAYYAVSSISLNGLLLQSYLHHHWDDEDARLSHCGLSIGARIAVFIKWVSLGGHRLRGSFAVSELFPPLPWLSHPIALPNERSTSCSPNASDLGRVPDDSCSVSGPLVPPSALELNLNSSLSYYSTRDSC